MTVISSSMAQIPPDAPNPPLLNPTAALVETGHYPGVRVADIAPLFALPDPKGKLWSSTSRLGQSNLLVISVTYPITDSAEVPTAARLVLNAQVLGNQIKTAVTNLEKSPVTLVVVASGAQFDELAQVLGETSAKSTNLLLLHEFEPVTGFGANLSQMLGTGESGVSVAAVDRAGFLRGVDDVDDLTSLGSRLQLMGDFSPRLEVGRAAPDFSMVDFRGRVRRLSDVRGKNLVLTFFPKCFTGGCANHLSSLQAELKSFEAANTQIWAVSFDSARGERGQIAFSRQLNLKFPLIPDTGRNLALLYEAAFSNQQPAPVRMTILIDRDGIVRHIDRGVQVRTHGPDTLLKMRELGLID